MVRRSGGCRAPPTVSVRYSSDESQQEGARFELISKESFPTIADRVVDFVRARRGRSRVHTPAEPWILMVPPLLAWCSCRLCNPLRRCACDCVFLWQCADVGATLMCCGIDGMTAHTRGHHAVGSTSDRIVKVCRSNVLVFHPSDDDV